MRLWVRDNETGGKCTVTFSADEINDCFLRHVLPTGFKRLRHCGILAYRPWHIPRVVSVTDTALQTLGRHPIPANDGDGLERLARTPSTR